MPRNSFYDGNAGDAVAIDNSAAAAATSETNAATSATNAATSETNAAASYDSFDDRYLGVKSSGPTLDNDGDALVDGALYFDTTTNTMMEPGIVQLQLLQTKQRLIPFLVYKLM